MTSALQHRLAGLVVLALLAAAIWLAFGRALDAPLVFDDHYSVIFNDSLRQLWPLSGPLVPPRDTPFAGRPLVNLSAAINYHFGQLDPTGYRLFNLTIHVASAMLLLGIVQRTLKLDRLACLLRPGNPDWTAFWLATTVALWWAVHPLQADSVCYLTQRTELMMGLCYLATLYFSLRFWQAPNRNGRMAWLFLATLTSAAGMASKEVMVSAPVVVLLYERTFIARSFRQALRDSWPLYVGVFSTWILLAYLNVDTPRARSAGFHLNVSTFTWWLTQAEVVVMYLRLAFWPWPLSIHHEIEYLHSLGAAWPYLLIVMLLGGGTLWALWRGWAIGFLGAWFFIILSPTSLVPITTEVAAERRMYLPLAAVVTLVVVGGFWLVARGARHFTSGKEPFARRWPITILAILAVLLPASLLCAVSHRRAAVFRDSEALWRDVLASHPNSSLAYVNLGCALMDDGDYTAAIEHFAKALEITPASPDAHYNWAVALKRTGQPQAAAEHLAMATRIFPSDFYYRKEFGELLAELGRNKEAAEQFAEAVNINPDAAGVRNSLGMALKQSNQLSKAAEALAEAVRLRPEIPESRNNYGNVLRLLGQQEAAIAQFREALRLEPDMREARYNMALTLGAVGRRDEAIAAYRQLLDVDADDAAGHTALANELFAAGRLDEAKTHFARAVALEPKHADARNNLGAVLIELDQADAAIDQLQEAVRLAPDSPVAHFNLAEALTAAGRRDAAIGEARQALDLARKGETAAVTEQIEAWLKSMESGQDSNPPTSP